MSILISVLTLLPLVSEAVELVSDDGGRAIEVTYEGNIKIVVWNSGEGFEKKYGPATDPDFARHFVCLDGATLYRDRAYVLNPGETHVLKATIAVRTLPHFASFAIIQPELVSE